MITPEKMEQLRQRYAKHIGQAFLRPNGPITPTPRAALQFGQRLRDHTVSQFPVLQGAIQAYVDLASTREWTVSGTPRIVTRSVEWINNAESINTHTGLVEYGYDSYLKRRAQDYLMIGMTAMASSNDLGDIEPPLEYIDPTLLWFQRERQIQLHPNGFVQKVRPEEKVWWYDRSRQIRSQDLIHHYPYPLGANGFISPVMYLLPTATLAWLIRESDSAQIDGRKIRDIFLVSDVGVADAIEEGVLTLLALWQGDSEQDIGIPIIPVSGMGQNQKVADLFARLGVSEIPPTLNREEFMFVYVNEIAAALGLALRHFWNNERTTNRALEVVQEQRQQQKGPSTFVRTEQRLLNRSGFLKRFGGARSTPRFGFIEETDISSMKDRAAALKDIAAALTSISTSLGVYIKPESLIAWMQIEDVLPNEIELVEIESEAVRVNPEEPKREPGEIAGESDPDTTTQPTEEPLQTAEQIEKSLDYGEIVMSGSGRVIAQRHKIFSVAKYLEEEIRHDLGRFEKVVEEAFAETPVAEESDESVQTWLKQVTAQSDAHSIQLVKTLGSNSLYLDSWREKNSGDNPGLLNDAIYNCLNNVVLTEDERKIIDRIAMDWETQHDS